MTTVGDGGATGVALRHQRDEWTEFVRRHAGDLRSYFARGFRRHWWPAARSPVRAGLWIAAGTLIVADFGCLAVAFWYDVRKHDLAGVPSHHFAVRLDGQPVHVPRGGGPV